MRGGWLVGADGAGSAVRKAVGLGFDGTTWDQRFVATDIRYDFAGLGLARTTMIVDPRFGAIVAQAEAQDAVGLWRYTFSEDLAVPEDGVGDRAVQRPRDALPGVDGGGLGLTSGLFDTYVLHPALAAVVQGRAPESVLDRFYSADRLNAFTQYASPAATENKRSSTIPTTPPGSRPTWTGCAASWAIPPSCWPGCASPRSS